MSAKFEVAFGKIKCNTKDHTAALLQNFLVCSFKKK